MIMPNRPEGAPAPTAAAPSPAAPAPTAAAPSPAAPAPTAAAPSTTRYELPPLGDNPSSQELGTTPGSFAQRGRIGTPWTFSSPDTPGMPPPSDKTAWDFLPPDWDVEILPRAGSGPDSGA